MSETGVDIRSYNVGKSNYAKHKIQPWDIWLEYNLNPWDADIVKRILRTKDEPGMSADEARIMDYDKIIHICNERKRQLNLNKLPTVIIKDNLGGAAMTYSLSQEQVDKYSQFCEQHSVCAKEMPTAIGGNISTIFTSTSVGLGVSLRCSLCGEELNITDYEKW